jgi:hypothetical protein
MLLVAPPTSMGGPAGEPLWAFPSMILPSVVPAPSRRPSGENAIDVGLTAEPRAKQLGSGSSVPHVDRGARLATSQRGQLCSVRIEVQTATCAEPNRVAVHHTTRG